MIRARMQSRCNQHPIRPTLFLHLRERARAHTHTHARTHTHTHVAGRASAPSVSGGR